jgi:uncharacterized damage-inducible protein DinB
MSPGKTGGVNRPFFFVYAERMQPLQPEQARFLLDGIYSSALENEHRITKAVIGSIPADKSEYRPDQISRSALELAWHIVATEKRFMAAVAESGFDFSPMPRPNTVKTPADLIAWYEQDFRSNMEKLKGLSNQQLLKIIDFRGMFQLPAVMYLGFILHHTVHHRGQLSMYLRPIGAKVPAIYGESYDSAEARKASMQPA